MKMRQRSTENNLLNKTNVCNLGWKSCKDLEIYEQCLLYPCLNMNATFVCGGNLRKFYTSKNGGNFCLTCLKTMDSIYRTCCCFRILDFSCLFRSIAVSSLSLINLYNYGCIFYCRLSVFIWHFFISEVDCHLLFSLMFVFYCYSFIFDIKNCML